LTSARCSQLAYNLLVANESPDPLLALYGSGKDLWADEDVDEYVRRIREGWDERTAWDHVEEEAQKRDAAKCTGPSGPEGPSG